MECEEEEDEVILYGDQIHGCRKELLSQRTGQHLTNFSTPKASTQILAYFEGNNDTLNYYFSLKATLAEMLLKSGCRNLCDPRASGTKERLKKSKWTPKIILKPTQDVHETEWSGFTSKQTALDDHVDAGEDAEVTPRDIDDRKLTENDDSGISGKPRDMEQNGDIPFVCGIQGCDGKFLSLASYESHYHTNHNFVCSMCRRVFVSNFLLEIHLEENHDSYFQILSPRVDMYRCLVESCNLKFRTPEVRKDHLITFHKFPASFSFHQPISHKNKKKKPQHQTKSSSDVRGIDANSTSAKLFPSSGCNQENLHSPSCTPSMEVDGDVNSKDFQETRRKGRNKSRRGGAGRGNRVPPTICFGRGSQRAFNPSGRGRGRHWHQNDGGIDTKVDIENLDMTDMMDSLMA